MKIFRTAVCLIFVAVTMLFGFLYVKDKLGEDRTIPVITVQNELSEVSVNVTEEELLEGVTAYDEKDKDITDKIVIESISKFSEKGVCKITYAVCDSDNHVATASKKIKYTDYKSPEFYSNGSLCFSDNESINLSGRIGAKDCLDGDISDNLILTTQSLTPRIAGSYSVDANVTNSRGDTVSLRIPVTVESRSINAPTLELKEYIVYTEQGKALNPKSFIKGATDKNGESLKTGDVEIKSSVNYQKVGVYTVDYYIKDADGNEGHTFLVVVVGSGQYE